MDNDEGQQAYWREQATDALDRADFDSLVPDQMEEAKETAISELEDGIKEQHEQSLPEVTGFASDLLNAAMSEVNWREIARHLVEEVVSELAE